MFLLYNNVHLTNYMIRNYEGREIFFRKNKVYIYIYSNRKLY